MMKKKNNKKMTMGPGEVNITSLLDVMTVLLFFLIQTASVNTLNVTLPDDIKLPQTVSQDAPEEAVIVSVSAHRLMADGKVLVEFKNGIIPSSSLEKDQRTIKPLKDYLDTQMKKQKDFFRGVASEGQPIEAKLMIQADKKLPFGVLKYVLHSAAIAGYVDYQFVAVPEN